MKLTKDIIKNMVDIYNDVSYTCENILNIKMELFKHTLDNMFRAQQITVGEVQALRGLTNKFGFNSPFSMDEVTLFDEHGEGKLEFNEQGVQIYGFDIKYQNHIETIVPYQLIVLYKTDEDKFLEYIADEINTIIMNKLNNIRNIVKEAQEHEKALQSEKEAKKAEVLKMMAELGIEKEDL